MMKAVNKKGGDMELQYFEDGQIDNDDIQHKMAVNQGYVPQTCRLGGMIIMNAINQSLDPCKGCHCDRSECHGRNV